MYAHLLVSLSAHGFGHIGQTAPLIRELLRRYSELTVTLRTLAPEYKLTEHIGQRLPQQQAATDVGMIQTSALEIDLEKSADAYAAFHRDWYRKVKQEAHDLRAAKPDLILSNVSYLTLAGAEKAGVPAIAIGNINWAVIYEDLFGNRPEAPGILDQMWAAYNSACTFLQPAPSMPMPMLDNAHPIGPIAKIGRSHREEIYHRLGLAPETRLVLVSLGGMDLRPPVEHWPRLEGIHLLVPESWRTEHTDMSPLEALGINFIDLLASCDVLIAKPGYGSFVEAACAGIPVLYLPRYNWPEVAHITAWLQDHGRYFPLSKSSYLQGTITTAVEKAVSYDRPIPPKPTGTTEAADYIGPFIS